MNGPILDLTSLPNFLATSAGIERPARWYAFAKARVLDIARVRIYRGGEIFDWMHPFKRKQGSKMPPAGMHWSDFGTYTGSMGLSRAQYRTDDTELMCPAST